MSFAAVAIKFRLSRILGSLGKSPAYRERMPFLGHLSRRRVGSPHSVTQAGSTQMQSSTYLHLETVSSSRKAFL